MVVISVTVAAAAAAVWFFAGRKDASPLSVPASALSSWSVVTSDGTYPWIVGARPPETFTRPLFDAASRRAGRPLVAPPHPALPLVLQSEFEESLQGVYGTDAVVRAAREAGIESAVFHPVCLARQSVDLPSGSVDVYFVPFDVPAFDQVRADLTPLEPEHAGIGIYDPAWLTPALVIGATGAGFERIWPIRFERERDCEAEILLAEQTPRDASPTARRR